MCQVYNKKPFICKNDITVFCFKEVSNDGKIRSFFFSKFTWKIGKVYKNKLFKSPEDIPLRHLVGKGMFHSIVRKKDLINVSKLLLANSRLFKAVIPAGSIVVRGKYWVDNVFAPFDSVASNQLKLVKEISFERFN